MAFLCAVERFGKLARAWPFARAGAMSERNREAESVDRDNELAQAARKGNKASFVTLVERHQKTAFNIALRMLRNRETALDMTQEAFLRAFEHRSAYDPTRPFGPWLYRIVSNLCLNELKRKKPIAKADLDPPDLSREPSSASCQREARRRLQEEVDALGEKYRTPFILRYLEDRSCQDVARIIGCPVNTVKIRLFRAREILRKRLGSHWSPKEAHHG